MFSAGALSFDETCEWMQRKRRLNLENGHSHWAVERKQDQRLVGVCGIVYQELPEGRFPEVGYRFARDVWGKGLATEAASACLDWAWANKNWGQVTAIIEPANRRSIRVAEKIGMHPAWETVYSQRGRHHLWRPTIPTAAPGGPSSALRRLSRIGATRRGTPWRARARHPEPLRLLCSGRAI